jgi:hypothetical protein
MSLSTTLLEPETNRRRTARRFPEVIRQPLDNDS